jgi:ClpP class serine protease
MIDRGVVEHIQELLDDRVLTDQANTGIDVWLESPGGDAHAAFKLYRELRSRCSRLRVAVPDYAKSAATLLAIGADTLFVAPAADFGPLDVQIEHPDREGRVVSSLAGANALEQLAQLGVDLTLILGPRLIKTTNLPRADVVRELLAYASRTLQPVLSKLDPQLIHEAAEQLKVTRRYAEEVLKSRTTPPKNIGAIAAALVTNYPTHGYVIDAGELARIGIATAPIADHPLWGRMKGVYKKAIHAQPQRGKIDLIRV